MPRQVDHEQRRQLIAEAVCRLAGRRGFDAVSLRHVAAEAGVSMGMVQHYFTTKDEMLLFAFKTMSLQVEQRISAAVADLPQPPSTRSLLRAILTPMVPSDGDSRLQAPLWVAFLARAIVEPSLASPLRDGVAALTDFVAARLRSARESGEIAAGIDPDHEAACLLALADGLMIRALVNQAWTGAMTTLDYHLARIFGADTSTMCPAGRR